LSPDVRDVALATLDLLGQRDAPREVGSRDTDVLEATLDDVGHLLAAVVRPDEVRMRLEVLEQRLVVLREAEEEVALLHLLGLHLVLGTAALLVEVLVRLEAFAALAVQPLVRLLVKHGLTGLGAQRVLEPAEQLLHGEVVALVGRADELVVLHVQRAPRVLEGLRQLVHERGGRLARSGGGARDLLAVLVGARQIVGGVALLAMAAGEGIGEDLLVRMTQVGTAIHVVDRGRDVETGH
jgi:hypothetical protein